MVRWGLPEGEAVDRSSDPRESPPHEGGIAGDSALGVDADGRFVFLQIHFINLGFGVEECGHDLRLLRGPFERPQSRRKQQNIGNFYHIVKANFYSL